MNPCDITSGTAQLTRGLVADLSLMSEVRKLAAEVKEKCLGGRFFGANARLGFCNGGVNKWRYPKLAVWFISWKIPFFLMDDSPVALFQETTKWDLDGFST